MTDIQDNMGVSQKHYVKQKKPNTQQYVSYKVQEQIVLMYVNGNEEVVAWRRGKLITKQAGGNFRGNEMLYTLLWITVT